MFEYRISDPSDVYARIAQQQQAWKLFLAHPLVGVGYGNYMEAAYNFPTVSYKGVDSVDSAHNTLGSILVEAGLSALVPFVAAQFVVVAAFWRLRLRRTPEARLTITLFAYVFLTYWITGVSLTSGYYSDLNMWYMFVLAFMYKFAVSSRLHRASGPIPVNCPLFV
jgi:O-antigen ligase